MPEPAESRTDARTKVLEAAAEVFELKGISATRVEDLLQAAGVARRTFYKYFRSKSDVLTRLYEHVTAELLGELMRAPGGDPWAGLRHALDVYLDFHRARRGILKLLVEQAVRSDSPLAPMRRRFRAGLVQVMGETFRRATGHRLDAYVFLALVSGLEGLSLEILEDEVDDVAIARVRQTILGLLEAAARSPDLLPRDGAP